VIFADHGTLAGTNHVGGAQHQVVLALTALSAGKKVLVMFIA
jgi:hypothetical protein